MQITRESLSPTSIKLSISADQKAIDALKEMVVTKLGENVKLPGFRPGTAPASMVEKNLDQSLFQSEFLNEAINQLYTQAITEEKIKVVKEPEISITKFVPFSTLEFTAQAEVVGDIKLGQYKSIKLTTKKVEISPSDVTNVVENLRQRVAKKEDVTRVSKDGDEVTIDFKGIDAKTKEAIDGADGQDFPLILGSKSFIPGFEEELIGLKNGQSKTFIITFPADYGVADLKNRKVSFDVTIKAVKDLIKPKADDDFASTVSPFKTFSELKADIKKQLQKEKQAEADQAFNNELLQKIADKSEVAIPKVLIDEEIGRLEEEEKRNIAYRGQTWQEHLKAEAVSEEEHKERQRPQAESRVKVGLILGEIAEQEKIEVSVDELETRLNLLKSQYQDESMRQELDKPENRRDIFSRIIIEKTIDRLSQLATAN